MDLSTHFPIPFVSSPSPSLVPDTQPNHSSLVQISSSYHPGKPLDLVDGSLSLSLEIPTKGGRRKTKAHIPVRKTSL